MKAESLRAILDCIDLYHRPSIVWSIAGQEDPTSAQTDTLERWGYAWSRSGQSLVLTKMATVAVSNADN